MGLNLFRKAGSFPTPSKASNQHWHQTFDAIPDLVSVLDNDFRFVLVNKALAGFLKVPEEELVGKHCYRFLHGLEGPFPECPHAAMLKSRVSVTKEVDDAYLGTPLLVTASPIFDEKGRLLGSIHIAKDISGLKKTEQILARRTREQEALNRLGRGALKGMASGAIFDLCLEHIMEVVKPDQVFIYLIEGRELREVGVRPVKHYPLPEKKLVGECLCGLAASGGRSVYSLDICADGRCTLNECKEAGVRSFAALPLNYGEEIIGVVGMASMSTRDFAEQKEFLETIAATVALIVKNSQMFQELSASYRKTELLVRERTAELESKNRELTAKIAEIERMNRIFVHRELRMLELKKKIQELEQREADRTGPDLGQSI